MFPDTEPPVTGYLCPSGSFQMGRGGSGGSAVTVSKLLTNFGGERFDRPLNPDNLLDLHDLDINMTAVL